MTPLPTPRALACAAAVFAHVKGSQAVQTAIAPNYAWIRFNVEHVDERSAPNLFSFMLRLSKAYDKRNGLFDQQDGVPMVVRPINAPLDAPLRMDRI